MILQAFLAIQAQFNMSEQILSFKKRLLIIFLFCIFLIIVLLLSLFAKKQTLPSITQNPTPTLVPVENPNNSTTGTIGSKIETAPSVPDNSLGNISFNVTSNTIPASGVIYTQAPSSIPANIISAIQSKLLPGADEKIINTPQGQVLFAQQDGKNLTIYLYSRTIVFTDPSPAPTNQQTSLEQKATDFIKSLTLPIEPIPLVTQYFLNKAGDLETADQSSGNVADVSFTETVKGLMVFRQYGSAARAHVWFSNGNVTKFTYVYSPVYEPKNSIPIPKIEDAEKEIMALKGTIVGLGQYYQQTTVKNIDKTVFTSVAVGYFNSGSDDLLSPIFIFKGTSTSQGTSYPITVYLPIVN